MQDITSASQNRQWVGRYAKALTVLGVLAIIASSIGVIVSSADYFSFGFRFRWWDTMSVILYGASALVRGFLALGVASFLGYAFGTRQEPGRMLRATAILFYIMAGIHVLSSVPMVQRILSATWRIQVPLMLVFTVLEGIVHACVWVALGLILKRVLPVIEESRTLV